MMRNGPFYISSKGGMIYCFSDAGGRIFHSCSMNRCVLASDLHSAKANLDRIESSDALLLLNSVTPSLIKKTSLKWNPDGELSEIDKARILDLLNERELKQCELTCNL